MSWQVLISISVILYSVSVLLQRVILKESSSRPIAYSIFFQLITGLFITIVGFFFFDFRFPNLLPIFGNLALMTFLYGFSNVFIFTSLKQTEASKFTIIFATRALFTILASSLLLKEMLTIQQIIGAFIIFSGVVLVSLKSTTFTFGKGELFALAGALCFGLANTNDRYLLQYFSVYPYMSIGFIAPAILMGLIYPKEARYAPMFLQRSTLPKVVVLCVVYAFSAISFFAALKVASSSSQVAAVNLTSVIITVLLSIIILKEREHIVQKLGGAVLSFIGLLLVS